MYLGTIRRTTVVQNRRTSVQKIHTLVQQTAYQLVRTIVPDRPDHPKCLYTQQLAIFKPRLSYFRLLKAQLNRSCLNLICYILWYASNKKCTERFEPLYKKVVPTTQTTVHGTVHFVQVRVPRYDKFIPQYIWNGGSTMVRVAESQRQFT